MAAEELVTGKQLSGVEPEALPTYVQEPVDIDYRKMTEQYRERSAFFDAVRKDALSKTRGNHWLARKDRSGNVTYSLMSPGAERVKTACPIGFLSIRRRREDWTKDSGPGYSIVFEASVFLGSERMGTLPVMGSCSSDDEFFAIEHSSVPYVEENPEQRTMIQNGEARLSNDQKTLHIRRLIPAREVDQSNIEKSALSNLIVNGVSRVLGIRNISEEELKEAGIDTSKLITIEYGSGKAKSEKLSPALEQKREEIWRMLVELSGGDEAKAAAQLKVRTAFKAREPGGSDYEGCKDWRRMTENQVNRHYENLKADYQAWREGSPEAGPKKGQPAAGPQKKAGGQQELL